MVDVSVKLQTKFFTVPNAITLTSLNLGAWSIFASLHDGDPAALARAALAIGAGAACDFVDGRVARALHEENPLGAQLDSLADFVSFGLAPAALAYAAGLSAYGLLGAAACAAYATATALRLARFNLTALDGPKAHFQGLPSSAAAVAATAAAMLPCPVDGRHLALMALLAALMISGVPFPSFKKGMPKVGLVVAPALLVPLGIFAGPAVAVLAAMAAFVVLAAVELARGAGGLNPPAARPAA